jgi:predicted RNA-binding Zn-ribbon protein involved in translation (DUF1610 family)
MTGLRHRFLDGRPDLQLWWRESVEIVRSVAAGGAMPDAPASQRSTARILPCPDCGKKYLNRTALTRHRIQMHFGKPHRAGLSR